MVKSWAHEIAIYPGMGIFSLSVTASIKLIDVSEILVSSTGKQGSFLMWTWMMNIDLAKSPFSE